MSPYVRAVIEITFGLIALGCSMALVLDLVIRPYEKSLVSRIPRGFERLFAIPVIILVLIAGKLFAEGLLRWQFANAGIEILF